MTVEKLNALIDQKVQAMFNSKVAPIVEAINSEVTRKANNEASKAALDKDSADCDERITKFQEQLNVAKQQVQALATELQAATAPVVS